MTVRECNIASHTAVRYLSEKEMGEGEREREIGALREREREREGECTNRLTE